jgi:hypothetical protein
MQKTLILILLLGLVLGACNGSSQTTAAENTLIVVEGDNQTQYTADDLKALPQTESVFDDASYVGVTLVDLLTEAGIEAQSLTAIKAIASDGYSVNYEPALFLRDDVILAYARTDGALAEDDGAFRMVLPGEEGKLNVRMVTEIQAVP